MLPRPTDRKSSDNAVFFLREGGGFGGEGGLGLSSTYLTGVWGPVASFKVNLNFQFSEVPGGSNICIPGGGGGGGGGV